MLDAIVLKVWACRRSNAAPSGFPLYSSLVPRCGVPLQSLTRNVSYLGSTMKLYKYTSINQRLYESLGNGMLWFANAKSFNDPYDCNSPVILGAKEEHIERYFHSISQAKRPELLLNMSLPQLLSAWQSEPNHIENAVKSMAAKALDEMGLLCLSANGKSIPMWAHYADSQKGVCLELEFESSEGDVFDGKDWCKVNYPHDKHYQKFFDDDKDPKKSIFGLALTKSPEWRSEEEYRVIQNSPGLYSFNRKTLTGVVFGFNASEASKATIKRLLTIDLYPNVRFGHVALDEDTYSLQVTYEAHETAPESTQVLQS